MRVNVLIDSFGWIEYFGDGPLADSYGRYIEKADKEGYFTPTVVLYEVYKKIKSELNEDKALEAYAYISAYTTVIPLDEKLALEAAERSLEQRLPIADAIIAATANAFEAKIVTGDPHLKGLESMVLIK